MLRTRLLTCSFLLTLSIACGDSGAGGAGGGGGGGSGGAPCEEPRRPEDDAQVAPIVTPRWAFRPWISKDISTGDDTRAFVDGFKSRDIPVSVVVLDSPWETNYNTFVPNPSRYPEFPKLVSDLKAEGVRVVLWTTQMINSSSYDLEQGGDIYEGGSPDFNRALACGYFVENGANYTWWKGQGGAIDFFDPVARAFWHRLQDPLFDMGVAGFKLDFGESYIETNPMATDAGPRSLLEYSQAYYEDFYRYGAARVGTEEFVTMVRPYDKSYQFEGRFFARPEHAPVAWVGDNRRDYVGMLDAIDHIFRSAEAGYVVVGSDLGGYLDRDDADLLIKIPADPEVFMRWTALSAMTPFMQLHGRANLEPWAYPEQTADVLSTYRYWAKLHTELVPFFDSIATQAYAGGATKMIVPYGGEASWGTTPAFVLGGSFLVVPVVDATGTRDVLFTPDARWFDLFDAAAPAILPGTSLSLDVADPTRIPVFVREGAIVPMEVVDDVTGFGNAASAGALTVLVYPAQVTSTFAVEGETNTIEVELAARRDGAGVSTIEVTDHPRPLVLRVQVDAAPTTVTFGGAPITVHPTRAAFDAASRGAFAETGLIWVKLEAGTAGALSIE